MKDNYTIQKAMRFVREDCSVDFGHSNPKRHEYNYLNIGTGEVILPIKDVWSSKLGVEIAFSSKYPKNFLPIAGIPNSRIESLRILEQSVNSPFYAVGQGRILFDYNSILDKEFPDRTFFTGKTLKHEKANDTSLIDTLPEAKKLYDLIIEEFLE